MITKEQIELLIKKPKKNDFYSHFKTMLDYDKTKYSGEIGKNEITLWRSAKFMKGTYPVFVFLFESNSKLIDLKIKKNKFEILSNKFFIGLAILFIIQFYFAFDNLYHFILFIGLFLLIGIGLFYFIDKNSRYEINLLKVELKNELLKLESNSKEEIHKVEFITLEKEKSSPIKDLILRIILYPFSIFLILFSIYNISTSLYFILGILFPTAYLISDLMYVFGKKEVNSKFFDFVDD